MIGWTGRTRPTAYSMPKATAALTVADSQSFNVIRDSATTGKNFRVRLQIKPGLSKRATLQ